MEEAEEAVSKLATIDINGTPVKVEISNVSSRSLNGIGG